MKAVFTAMLTLFLFGAVNAQFETPNPVAALTPQLLEEVRTDSSITYSLVANHIADEQYRWAVIGGTITGTNNGATVTTEGTGAADSSVVEFSANTYEITVTWDADLSSTPIGSFAGEIWVQKKSVDACPSQLQMLPVTQWNMATAEIDAGSADFEICSGDAVGGTITLNLTGAPDDGAGNGFQVTYDITSNGNLTDLGGGSIGATGQTTVSNTATATIPLPDGLISSNTTGDETFEIVLTAMHDDFDGDGLLVNKTTFEITVHPTVETGPIVSGRSLSRR